MVAKLVAFDRVIELLEESVSLLRGQARSLIDPGVMACNRLRATVHVQ